MHLAEALGPDHVDVELELAAGLVEGDVAVGRDGDAAGQHLAAHAVAEHDAADLAVGLLEGEVHVAEGGAGEAGDLAGDPEVAEDGVPLEGVPQVAGDLGDGVEGHGRRLGDGGDVLAVAGVDADGLARGDVHGDLDLGAGGEGGGLAAGGGGVALEGGRGVDDLQVDGGGELDADGVAAVVDEADGVALGEVLGLLGELAAGRGNWSKVSVSMK